MSYSQFDYTDIKLSQDTITINELESQGLDIRLKISNLSHYDGYEIVQIYLIDNESSITRRYKELKAFQKDFYKKQSQQGNIYSI